MTEEQYEYIKKLVNNDKISSIKKYSNDLISNYVIKTKPNKEKVVNKYRCEIPNSDRGMIEKLDTLIVQHRTIEKTDRIENLQVAVAAVAIAATLTAGFIIANKNTKALISTAEETNTRIEQMEKEFGRDFNQEIREQVFKQVQEERQQKLQNIDNEIERLKQEREQLTKSYYESSDENAKLR